MINKILLTMMLIMSLLVVRHIYRDDWWNAGAGILCITMIISSYVYLKYKDKI